MIKRLFTVVIALIISVGMVACDKKKNNYIPVPSETTSTDKTGSGTETKEQKPAEVVPESRDKCGRKSDF